MKELRFSNYTVNQTIKQQKGKYYKRDQLNEQVQENKKVKEVLRTKRLFEKKQSEIYMITQKYSLQTNGCCRKFKFVNIFRYKN